MSTPPRLTTSAYVARIRAMISYIRIRREQLLDATAGYGGDVDRIEVLRKAFWLAVTEFGWCWEEVAAVLDALAPEEGGSPGEPGGSV